MAVPPPFMSQPLRRNNGQRQAASSSPPQPTNSTETRASVSQRDTRSSPPPSDSRSSARQLSEEEDVCAGSKRVHANSGGQRKRRKRSAPEMANSAVFPLMTIIRYITTNYTFASLSYDGTQTGILKGTYARLSSDQEDTSAGSKHANSVRQKWRSICTRLSGIKYQTVSPCIPISTIKDMSDQGISWHVVTYNILFKRVLGFKNLVENLRSEDMAYTLDNMLNALFFILTL
ncbi:hypothetical protein K435DRAFT_940690, partial [Dendrothele bispora CBS 962.96]